MDSYTYPLTPIGRLCWAGSHLYFAALGPTIMLAVLGLAIGLGYGSPARIFARTMAVLPAVWVMTGLAAALYGLLPRAATALSWALFGVSLLLELGWELQLVSQTLFNISPFAHVHWARPISPAALVWLTVVAGVLTAAGMKGFGKRDVG